MASNDYIPNTDAAYDTWLMNFASKCTQYTSLVGFTPAQLLQISNASSEFTDALTTLDGAKIFQKSATAAKVEARSSTVELARTFAKKVRGVPGIPASVLQEFGIVSSTESGPVTTVTSLTVFGCSDGVNKLTWNRGKNSPSTIFIVEYKEDGAATWNFAAAVTRTTFSHDEQVPGQMTWYRIISTRAGDSSAPTPPVAVYGETGEGTLSVAA
jgi:hypothetical protein